MPYWKADQIVINWAKSQENKNDNMEKAKTKSTILETKSH